MSSLTWTDLGSRISIGCSFCKPCWSGDSEKYRLSPIGWKRKGSVPIFRNEKWERILERAIFNRESWWTEAPGRIIRLAMLTIPNIITLLRLFLVPVILASLWAHDYQKALLFFVIAGITDALDGFLARRLNQKTLIGAILDPIADKTLIDSIYLVGAYLKLLPAWLASLVLGRDFFILIGFLGLTIYTRKLEVRPTYLSKGTTVAQVITIVVTLADVPFQKIFFYFTGVLTLLSGIHYLWIGIKRLLQNKEVEQSL